MDLAHFVEVSIVEGVGFEEVLLQGRPLAFRLALVGNTRHFLEGEDSVAAVPLAPFQLVPEVEPYIAVAFVVVLVLLVVVHRPVLALRQWLLRAPSSFCGKSV